MGDEEFVETIERETDGKEEAVGEEERGHSTFLLLSLVAAGAAVDFFTRSRKIHRLSLPECKSSEFFVTVDKSESFGR